MWYEEIFSSFLCSLSVGTFWIICNVDDTNYWIQSSFSRFLTNRAGLLFCRAPFNDCFSQYIEGWREGGIKIIFRNFLPPPPLLENLSMCLFISSLKKPSNENSSELFGVNSHLFVRVILDAEFWNKFPTKTPTFRQFSSFSVHFEHLYWPFKPFLY